MPQGSRREEKLFLLLLLWWYGRNSLGHLNWCLGMPAGWAGMVMLQFDLRKPFAN